MVKCEKNRSSLKKMIKLYFFEKMENPYSLVFLKVFLENSNKLIECL